MFDQEQFVNTKYSSTDSQNLQTIQRKISKQKLAAAEHSNGNSMYESPHFRASYSTTQEFDSSLRHSAGARMLHGDNDIILSNDFHHQEFHQPNTRKITKITPKENSSLTNSSRPNPPRSASALPTKHETKVSIPIQNDEQRLKNVRRHEPAHVPSGSASNKSLITPESWKHYPVVLKTPAVKKRPTETVSKPAEKRKPPTETVPKPAEKQLSTPEQSSIPQKPKADRPKRARSQSKPSNSEPVPSKKQEKTKEEKEKIQKYIEEKRQEQEKLLLNEKHLKAQQENDRKEKLKKLNEQIKKVAQQPLPPSLIKKNNQTQLSSKDSAEQTRERLLQLLGPRIVNEPPMELHRNTPFEQTSARERSLSISSTSSSSSSESVVEIRPPQINQTVIRSEPLVPTGIEQRHQNILRWALNLTRDCESIETKFRHFRPDGTQAFDLIPSSESNLQHDDGNLRSPIPFVITNEKKSEPKPKTPSKVLRPSGRLTNLNRNHSSEYENQQLPGVGNLRDPLLEQRVKHDRAATKIQSFYRGYTVRKALHWINDKDPRKNNDFNKRSIRKPTKVSSYPTDIFDTPALNLDMRFSDDKFTIGSTLLRQFQRNGINILSPSPTPIVEQVKLKVKPSQQKPSPVQTYSDDYENVANTRSSTPLKHKSISEKARITPLKTADNESTTSSTSTTTTASSSSSSRAPTPTPEPVLPSSVQRYRSISPPLPPSMSPNNGRAIRRSPPPPPPVSLPTTISRRIFDERRYSPNALERQLNAELHLLDGVEASMKQVENMERLRSVALAQQEVVSLAQILKNKPSIDILPQQTTHRPAVSRQHSSSSASSSTPSSHRKHRSPSPHQRHRDTQSSTSSTESILTAREKRIRQKYHSETELKAYEKRLKDVEKKIHVLVKRATEIYDEKTPVQSPRNSPKSDNDSSISEEIPVSQKSSSSTNSTVQRKPSKDTSEIYTETFEKDTDSSSIHQIKSDTITTDVSELERRINTYQKQIDTKKAEFEKLKQRKTRDDLRRQEDELKKQLQNYNQQIENIRKQEKTLPPPAHVSPLKTKSSSSSSSNSSTPRKQESSIAEDLPAVSTTSQSKTDRVQEKRSIALKQHDFFDDDEEEEEELPPKKPKLKSLETPRDERDTQHDAQSISIATDIAASSENELDNSRRSSTDNEKSILNFNTIIPPPLQSKDPSSSSSSSSSSTTTPSKKSPIANDYDEDFSEVSRSPSTPTKQPISKPKIDEIDVESIQEDIEDKPLTHSTNQSVSSKSSDDEQSEILVLNKKSANTTPRIADEKPFEGDEDDFPLPPPSIPPSFPESRIELNNDDTSHDISEDEEIIEQETKIDRLTDSFLRTFIDEAISQGNQIKRLKTETNAKKHLLTQEAKEWVSEDDDLTDEENVKSLEPIESTELAIDLSGLNDKCPGEETSRKAVVEKPIEIFVPHTREQVVNLTEQAVKILFDQNMDFSDRETIRLRIPESYFQTFERESDTDDIRRNQRAYCQMILNLSLDLLHEMYSDNVQLPEYPDWQKTKLVPKRFSRGRKPRTREEAEAFVQEKVLEILNLNSRQITYSKWRVAPIRRPDVDKFENVLDEEIRRAESQWINYDDECIQIKFDIADSIFDQLMQDTLTECLSVVTKRLYLSSNSTRF